MLVRETPELDRSKSVDVKSFPQNWRELKSRKILETTRRQALNRWANYLGNIWPECWDGGSLGGTSKRFWQACPGHFSGQVGCSREFRSWAPNGFYTRKTADMCRNVNLGWMGTPWTQKRNLLLIFVSYLLILSYQILSYALSSYRILSYLS